MPHIHLYEGGPESSIDSETITSATAGVSLMLGGSGFAVASETGDPCDPDGLGFLPMIFALTGTTVTLDAALK